MPINDRTRKILWGNSGNRCSICKRKLIVDATDKDDISIIGEECHIVSGQINGPRYDTEFDREKIDSHENLILLCRVHHKMIDDQVETYTADILKQMKSNHEKWVSEKLSDENKKEKPYRIRQGEENLPKILFRITSGKEVLNIVDGVMGYSFDYDDPLNEQDSEMITQFVQTVQNYGEIMDVFEAGNRVEAAFYLTKLIDELDKLGYLVFGFREISIIEGGNEIPAEWPIAIINIKHKENKDVQKFDLKEV
ncbi:MULTISPECIES: HNH endonuclease signature motif containing protein [Paenibacillus]|uniref:HNH endonuclease signature motif containing protein n=1 Tax=Paenibacillus illinoisensis TaxID=59845 RepID=UPI001C8D3510|nr:MULTISPECIES: HNH endonuclease signature motif containing protein [Paenibacillus]MBY0216254.1 HNH endonuclease [Paenibacillus illinoisensis]WJH30675.1 HNH endonuclease [Paenibacillus sp. CC-CFT742]